MDFTIICCIIIKKDRRDCYELWFHRAGNMAGAIIKGMTVGTGSFDGKDIFVYDLNTSAARSLADMCKVNVCSSAEDVIASSDVLVLAR